METAHLYYPPSPCTPSTPPRMTHKQSARTLTRVRSYRHRANLVSIPHSQATSDIFRSPRVMEEVVQVEKNYQLLQQRSPMTPEEAFDKLRHVVSIVTSNRQSATFNGVGVHEMLNGLEAACWQSFVSQDDGHSDGCARNCSTNDRNRQSNQQPKLLYSQLLSGTEEMLREEEAACQKLRDQIQQVEGRTDELPKMIQECQAAVARAMKSAAYGTVSLERRQSLADLTDVDVTATTASIREEFTETRRRKDLRMRVCNDLRAGLNELITRKSELKQLVSIATTDVKREEQANKQRAKRLEDLRTISAASSLLPIGRGGSNTSTQQQLARLTLALAKNQVLQEARKERKAFVRARTETIFDVRSQLCELNTRRVAVEKELNELEEEAAQMKRSFTPRPDWNELHDATVVTTAVDRVDPTARMRMGATRNKLAGAKAADFEEDRASEQRIMQILSSNWSTIQKVGAMATELAKIRSRDHTGDTILAEQKKLEHLHKEINRLMQQLEAVKAQSAA